MLLQFIWNYCFIIISIEVMHYQRIIETSLRLNFLIGLSIGYQLPPFELITQNRQNVFLFSGFCYFSDGQLREEKKVHKKVFQLNWPASFFPTKTNISLPLLSSRIVFLSPDNPIPGFVVLLLFIKKMKYFVKNFQTWFFRLCSIAQKCRDIFG